MDPLKRYLIDEAVEDYAEGRITRREALSVITGLAGAVLAADLLAACGRKDSAAPGPERARAPEADAGSKPLVAVDDPDITAATATFAGDGATLSGYLARPSKAGTFPVVLVCHENRGLTPHIEDVTRRLAKAGYVGMAVDLLSREGGTAKIGYEERPKLLGGAPPERHVGDFRAGLAYASAQPG